MDSMGSGFYGAAVASVKDLWLIAAEGVRDGQKGGHKTGYMRAMYPVMLSSPIIVRCFAKNQC